MVMTRFITRTMLQGLSVVLPIGASLYLLVWLGRGIESLTAGLVGLWLPESIYFPGLGVILFVALVFGMGLLMYPWITRALLGKVDRVLRRIPLFNSIYSPVKDLMNLFGGDITDKLGRVVMVRVPNTEMETLGFITRESDAGLPPGILREDQVVVYVQWSSQLGGYCFIVPRSSIREVDMSVEEGIRWSLTAGISARGEKGAPSSL